MYTVGSKTRWKVEKEVGGLLERGNESGMAQRLSAEKRV